MTREEAIERKSLYLEAEKAILTGAQSYNIGGQQLTRASLKEIRDMIASLDAYINGTGIRRIRRFIPESD